MVIQECSSFRARIYIAGPMDVAEQVIREFVMQGACLNIHPNKYIYTGGEEIGYTVEFINYPRFPASEEQILESCMNLADKLLDKTFQKSYTIVTPYKSYFKSIVEA